MEALPAPFAAAWCCRVVHPPAACSLFARPAARHLLNVSSSSSSSFQFKWTRPMPPMPRDSSQRWWWILIIRITTHTKRGMHTTHPSFISRRRRRRRRRRHNWVRLSLLFFGLRGGKKGNTNLWRPIQLSLLLIIKNKRIKRCSRFCCCWRLEGD